MNAVLVFVLASSLVFTSVKATLQRDVLTYINVFRHLHAAGPLLVDDVIQNSAQNAATIFMRTKSKDTVPIYSYSANFCTYTGSEANLDRTCVISWYVSMKYYVWCHPKAEGQALPFVNMIWKASTKAGVGIAKDKDGTFYVVVYIALQDENNVAGNVPPVKTVMEASPKAKCPPGYSRFGTSCFKYETTAVTWDEAVTRCARENATLASIRNAKEEVFVRDLQKKTGSSLETWIGLHDSLHEGRFKWFDGLRFHKHVCVPVHADGGNIENCVAWSINKPKGCWDDRRCNEKIPFTCRIPVEGKSTYRTEVLFKKFRWRPNYKDKNSKAYRDLVNGIKITFKEIFTRMSGKKKGGFRKVKVKGVRAIAFKGRPAGLGIAVSIKFRSFTPDPTARFQKFLRSSEKLISMSIDKPDKVEGKTGKAGDYCYGTCKHQGRCSASLQSSHSYYPGYPAPSPPPPPPYSTPGAYSVYYPGNVQTVTSTSDPYPSGCPMSCSQHPTLDCYMQCNDECCESRNGKRKSKPNAITAMMKEKFGKLNPLIDDERKRLKHKPGDLDDMYSQAIDLGHNTTETDNKVEGKEKFGKLSPLIDDERKQLKHKPGDLDDMYSKAIDLGHNTTETDNKVEDVDAENVIETLKKKIEKLQIRLKKKNQPKQHNNLNEMNDSIERNDDYFSTISNKTELSSSKKNNDRLTTATHDLIDDDQEPSELNEDGSNIAPKNVSSTIANGSEHGQEDIIGITINDKERGVENDSLINDNTIKTFTERPSIQVKDGAIDEKKKSNKNAFVNIYEPGDKISGESNEDENESENSESEPLSEEEHLSLLDSAIDPTEELLDEEGIDDVGKFGRKRDMIRRKKKPH